jgi:NitT/TauT family transport system ATP-binding protein
VTHKSAIRFEDVWLAYTSQVSNSPRIVLKEISFTVEENECAAVVGPSGIGKTSLLKLTSGLLEPLHGRVILHESLTPKEALSRRHFAWMFQDPNLLGWKTAIQNVEFPGVVIGDGRLKQSAEEMIHLVGLYKFKDYYPHQLSGGMRSRIALARALTYHPRILLLDEPFGALDELTRRSLGFEIQDLVERRPVTTVLVTHSVPEAVALADKVIVLAERPASIKAVIDVDLPRPRSASICDSEEFLAVTRQIRELLRGMDDEHA